MTKRLNLYWILAPDGKTPVVVDDVLEWGNWFNDTEKRIVFQTDVGDSQVSTVFIGIDHSYTEDGPPVLWETMVFGGGYGEQMEQRYSSYDAAVAGHTQIVTELRKRHDGESK